MKRRRRGRGFGCGSGSGWELVVGGSEGSGSEGSEGSGSGGWRMGVDGARNRWMGSRGGGRKW